jgi:hypothetical protein
MTGLTETEHLVAALEAGGVDYVTKPIKPKEVLARMGVHLQGARAHGAPDAQCARRLRLRQHHRAARRRALMWQTPLARDLLKAYYGHAGAGDAGAHARLAAAPHADAASAASSRRGCRRTGRRRLTHPPAPADRTTTATG